MGCSVSWKYSGPFTSCVAHGYELHMVWWHGSLENEVASGGVVAVFREDLVHREKVAHW